jgi:VWFA-related protein
LALAVAALSRTEAQFRSRTDLVEIAAVVVDEHGAPVDSLGQSDFEIKDDGRSVPLAAFAAVNADAAASPADGRLIVLLLDDVLPTMTERIKQVATMFADRMTGEDVGAVLYLNGSRHTTTTNRDRMLRQIDKLKPSIGATPARRFSGGNDIASMPSDACAECGNFGSRLTPSDGNGRSASHVLETIAAVSRQLALVEHRRKTIICIGNAGLFDLKVSERSRDYSKWLDAIRETSRADVTVDVIDVRGLTGDMYDGARGFAAETGGRAFVDSGDFTRAVNQIWWDSGHYYLLGYETNDANLVGRTVIPRSGTHDVNVRLLRPGLTVRVRRTRA